MHIRKVQSNLPISGHVFCINSINSSLTSPCTMISSTSVTDEPHANLEANNFEASFKSISNVDKLRHTVTNFFLPLFDLNNSIFLLIVFFFVFTIPLPPRFADLPLILPSL